MDDARAFGATLPGPRGRTFATSLFGSAVLATVATASVGHAQTYFSTANSLEANTVPLTGGFIVLGGYNKQGDGGGGTFRIGGTACTVDYGLVLADAHGTCYYRLDPTFSVREWGAFCDVVEVNSNSTLTAIWQPGSVSGGMSGPGTLMVPTAMMSPLPQAGQFIAISQVGGPTIWTSSSTGADPAVSMTRRAILGGASQTGYKVGDLISFESDSISNQGSFSQQAAIVVDAVNSGGTITQSHFLWGGVYDAEHLPAPTGGVLIQDDTRSYCGNVCGAGSGHASGAILTPAWSGWSVLNSQTISAAGSGYTIGATVTLSSGGGTINQSQYPEIIVEGTNGSGGVTAFDWVDYGSFSVLPSNPTTLTATSGGLTLGSVAWTRGPFATTIASVGTVGSFTYIVLADAPPAPYAYPYGFTMAVQSFYYGDDDYAAINRALLAKPTSSLVIPAGCGTTQPLNLLQDSSANNANPALVGGNVQSSGIYAFAYPLALRHTGAPVLNRVLYGGLVNGTGNGFVPASGGGFRNMFVEGFGIPEGYGYYGVVQGVAALHGYQGPSAAPHLIPSAGTAVEIDAASLMRIDNVHIANGGIGSGNSAFQCGLGESDPTGAISGADARITFTNSWVDANPAFFAGPTNPDFALRLAGDCRGSVYRNLTANDGIKADVLQYDGNTISQIHVDSDAINSTVAGAPAPTINWTTIANFGLDGAADFGVYVLGATSLQQTVCGIANKACVVTIPDVAAGSFNAGQITDTQMRCAAFTNVPTGYTAVELGAFALTATTSGGTANTAVSGTASAGKCAVPPLQLVRMDAPADPTTSLCNNSNALVAGCTGHQGGFAAGQFYTQPAISYASVTVSGGTLYAVPFFSPASGGPITKLAVDVVATGAATLCDVGVYAASNGQPTTRIVDGGTISVTSTLTTPATLTTPVTLAPQTLYFLAVGCNDSVMLEGARNNTGALSNPLIGVPNYVATTTQITAAWTFVAGGLPPAFGTITSAPGSIPNVYAGP